MAFGTLRDFLEDLEQIRDASCWIQRDCFPEGAFWQDSNPHDECRENHFNLAHPKLLILRRGGWASPYILIEGESSKRWECGNREAISKGGGKGGKPAFGFPGL